jgi:hypothetical protein
MLVWLAMSNSHPNSVMTQNILSECELDDTFVLCIRVSTEM